MSRALKLVGLVWIGLILILGSFAAAHAAQTHHGRQQLHGHVPQAVLAGAHDNGKYDRSKKMWLAIELPWRNQSQLEDTIKQIYDPSSPLYHHYLNVQQFTDAYGPTQEDYQTVMDYMKSKGLKVMGTHENRLLLDVQGLPEDIEATFNVEIHSYTKADGTVFYAPNQEPSLDLDVPINHIGGLDNANPPHPLYRQRPIGMMPQSRVIHSAAGMAITEEGTYGNGTGTSNCSGCYIGNDLRNAYVPGVTLTGSGQVSSIIAVDGYYASDISTYLSKVGLPNNVPIVNVLVDGFDGTVHNSTGNGENSLDIEQQLSFAPGLSQLRVYEGSANIDDDINKVATENIAKTTSVSYGWGPDTTLSSIGQEFAAQGQSLFIASGDGGAYVGGESGDSASENPYVTVVGGTDLFTNGPGGAWQSESAWVDGGGGIGLDYSIPGYQTGISMSSNDGSTTQRNVPDVAMNANFNYLIITLNPSTGGDEADNIGGTSASTPLWAAFTALVNQQAVAGGKPTIGFINPLLKTIGTSSNYTADFHDIATGNNNNSGNGGFNAVSGYDLATGWGSPNGQNAINALSQAAGAPTATNTATATPVIASTWRVRAGTSSSYTDCQSNVWVPDENFVGGGENSAANSISNALPCSTDGSLYQTERYGSFYYVFHVPAGSYQVTLKFAELFDNGSGQRIENITINGQALLSNFDIFATAGGTNIGVDKVFSSVAPSNGAITITVAPTSGSPDQNAKIDAIQIVPMPATATYTPTKTNTPTNTLTFTNTPTSTPTATPVVKGTWRIAAGNANAYTDCQNNVWSPDSNYNVGSSNGNTNTITKALPCTTDGALYQKEHWNSGSFVYTFNVPAGSYQTTLKFAEIFDAAAGQRIMNVTINGTQVLTNFDIFADAGGANIADDKVFNNIAPVNGQIVITFTATSSSPDQNCKVDALQIIPQPATPTNTATSTATKVNTATSTMTSTSTSTSTNSSTVSSTPTLTYTLSSTPSFTGTSTWTPSFTPTLTGTFTWTPSNSPTVALTNTATAASTSTSTSTAGNTSTTTSTSTLTPVPPKNTATSTLTSTNTPVNTSTATVTNSSTAVPPTATNTNTSLNTATLTNTVTSTASFTPTSTWTKSFTPTATVTNTWTNSFTPVPPTATATWTKTFTAVPPTSTATFSFTPTKTNTPTNTPVPPTATPTSASACSGVPTWNGNFVYYAAGTKVTYNGELYSCIQAHTSEPNWMPSVVPALWKDLGPCTGAETVPVAGNCSGLPVWNGNFVAYAAGVQVSYNNEIYQCIQSHTSETNWMPPAVPALWKDMGACGATASTAIKSAVAGPNISRNFQPVKFYIQLNLSAQVQVDIYTTLGQRVAGTTFFGNPGMNNWLWDVRNASQSIAASGLYVYAIRVTVNGNTEEKTGKIVLLH